MKPFYFGAPEKPLFGIYSAPTGHSSARSALVVCYPFGPEYVRAHRALRELSHHLTQRGHHALRFDYFGCGDSSGSGEEGTVEQWLEDIAQAVEELRESSGLPRVSLLGLRFGATLAALAASRHPSIDRLVLWDPIVIGAAYLEELALRHRQFMEGRPRPRGWVEADPPDEVLGATLTPVLRAGIAATDLLSLTRPPARRVLLISTEEKHGQDVLSEHLEKIGTPTDRQHVPSPPLWLKQDQVDKTLVPQEVIQRIASWLGGEGA
jgi:pimeloyl-ACP methyl ester carboxylesterase